MTQHAELIECHVLHIRPFRDTSVIIDVFSRCTGRFSLVAKGLRGTNKHRQQWRAALQIFSLCAISWQGRGELKNLTDVQLLSRAIMKGQAMYCGFYLNELLERLLYRYDAHPELFDEYQRAMHELAAFESPPSTDDVAPVLRRFEFRLLESLGFGVDFTCCYDTGCPIETDSYYVYDPENGFRRTSNDTPGALSGTDLNKIATHNYDSAAVSRAGRQLSRQLLSPLLGEKPLASRELFTGRRSS